MKKKTAFVFAGQGAQAAGMGRSLYSGSKAARMWMDTFDALRPGTLKQCFEPEGDELNQTINTQPCLFLVNYACAMATEEAGIAADCAAGFSLGEVAAATFTGMMDFRMAARFVMKRAAVMEACSAAHPGGMFAVLKLSSDRVEELAREFSNVYPVNYNAPGQTVVSCAVDEMDAFAARIKDAGGRAMPLKVSGCFHTPFMSQASSELTAFLEKEPLKTPRMPLYANRTAQPYEGDMAGTLAGQVSSPVRWQRTIERMAEDGVERFIEMGPGTVLCGLIKRILPEAEIHHVSDMESLIELKSAIDGGKA